MFYENDSKCESKIFFFLICSVTTLIGTIQRASLFIRIGLHTLFPQPVSLVTIAFNDRVKCFCAFYD